MGMIMAAGFTVLVAMVVSAGVIVLVGMVVSAGVIVLVGMVVGVIVAAAGTFILGVGEQVEKAQHHHADAADEHERTEEAVGGQVVHHATADVEVDHDAAP